VRTDRRRTVPGIDTTVRHDRSLSLRRHSGTLLRAAPYLFADVREKERVAQLDELAALIAARHAAGAEVYLGRMPEHRGRVTAGALKPPADRPLCADPLDRVTRDRESCGWRSRTEMWV
jgi:hypothetical protein